MKIAIVNSFDARGGAAIATYRIHRALRATGIDSHMFVATKDTDDPTVHGRSSWAGDGLTKIISTIDTFPIRHYRNRRGLFSPAQMPWVPDFSSSGSIPDLVHLFWINAGFVGIGGLKRIKQPIIWTLHDMWPFTGGCHYDDECGRYVDACGRCPVLGSDRVKDMSSTILNKKRSKWQSLPITIVATSKWLSECVKSSSLFKDARVEIIPNCVDTNLYQPLDKTYSKILFGLDVNKKTIVFSGRDAHKDPRKGLAYFFESMKIVEGPNFRHSDIQIVLLGISEDVNLPETPFAVHRISRLRDEYSQAALYSAADLLVAPSTQENLSNTVVEAMSCGIPVVAFNIGGMPDIIVNGVTGYLAAPFSAEDFATGISWILSLSIDQTIDIRRKCRDSAIAKFSETSVASRYVNLYREVLG